MNKIGKQEIIDSIKHEFETYPNVYVTETESIDVKGFSTLRRICFENGIKVKMAKNTLIKRVLDDIGAEKYSGMRNELKGVSVLFFSQNPKDPATIISKFRSATKGDKPVLKVALIDEDLFVGDNQLSLLKVIKSKQELIGDVLTLLYSPIQSVLSGLQGVGSKLVSTIEALEEKKSNHKTSTFK